MIKRMWVLVWYYDIMYKLMNEIMFKVNLIMKCWMCKLCYLYMLNIIIYLLKIMIGKFDFFFII